MACGKAIGILKHMRTKMSISEPLRIDAVGANGSDFLPSGMLQMHTVQHSIARGNWIMAALSLHQNV